MFFAIYEDKISCGKTIEAAFVELAKEFDAEDVSIADCAWYDASPLSVSLTMDKG